MMRIVVDAMGSDGHPGPDVAAAVMAARQFGDTIILVGDKAKIEAEPPNALVAEYAPSISNGPGNFIWQILIILRQAKMIISARFFTTHQISTSQF